MRVRRGGSPNDTWPTSPNKDPAYASKPLIAILVMYECGPLAGVSSHGIGLIPIRVGTGDRGVWRIRAVVEEEYMKSPTRPYAACGSRWWHEWFPSW